MVGAKRSYEDFRQQRLEENKKRMEELNITKLVLNLQKPSPKPSPAKQSKPRIQRLEGAIVRRSSRVANIPPPVYKEVRVNDFERPRPRKFYKRSTSSNRASVSDEDRLNALERAEDLESTLEESIPSFVKGMLHSHVKVGFWLGLPNQFSRKYLPKRDSTITLIDEDGEEYPTTYLAQKTGLSAGWRGFALEKDLADGDALVFQLVKPTTFKVYILRLHDSEEE